MKEFNLELAKQGAEVCTRDGKTVRIVDFKFNSGFETIIACISNPKRDGYEYISTHFDDGKVLLNADSVDDLFMK